jgi:hypothetical protein
MGKMAVWEWLWLNTIMLQPILYILWILHNRTYLSAAIVAMDAATEIMFVVFIWYLSRCRRKR